MTVHTRNPRFLRSVLLNVEVGQESERQLDLAVVVGREGRKYFTEISGAGGDSSRIAPDSGFSGVGGKRHYWTLPDSMPRQPPNLSSLGQGSGGTMVAPQRFESEFDPTHWARAFRELAFPPEFLSWLERSNPTSDGKIAEFEINDDVAAWSGYRDKEPWILLRILLELKDWELKQIPWEYLFPPSRKWPVSLVRTRTLHHLGRDSILHTRSPYLADASIVVACANPRGYAPDGGQIERFDAEREVEAVSVLSPFWRFAAFTNHSPGRLIDPPTIGLFCRRRQASVLHLACHGEIVGGTPLLYFESPQGPMPYTATQFAIDLDRSRCLAQLKLIVLNVCWGSSTPNGQLSIADTLIEVGAPAVLAWSSSVRQTISASFAHDFYQSLGSQFLLGPFSVEGALCNARRAMHKERTDDWGLPTLTYRRSSAGRETHRVPDAATVGAKTVGANFRSSGPHLPSNILMLWPYVGLLALALVRSLKYLLPRSVTRKFSELELPRFQTAAHRWPRWLSINILVSTVYILLGCALLGRGSEAFTVLPIGAVDTLDRIYFRRISHTFLSEFERRASHRDVGGALSSLSDGALWNADIAVTDLRAHFEVMKARIRQEPPQLLSLLPVTSERVEEILNAVDTSFGEGAFIIYGGGFSVFQSFLVPPASGSLFLVPRDFVFASRIDRDYQSREVNAEVRLGTVLLYFMLPGNLAGMESWEELRTLGVRNPAARPAIAYMIARGLEDGTIAVVSRVRAAKVAWEMLVQALADGVDHGRLQRTAVRLIWAFAQKHELDGIEGAELANIRRQTSEAVEQLSLPANSVPAR